VSPALGTNPLKETLFKRTTGKAGEQPAPQEALRPPDDEAPAPETPLQPPPESIQAVAFNIGGNRFGVDIQQVSYISRMVEITKVPRAPQYMEGIIDLRGQIVPVMSLQKLFGWSRPADVLDMYILVGHDPAKPVGMTVDSVTTLTDVNREQLESPSQTDRLAALLSWVAKLDDGIMFILDFDRLNTLKDAPNLAEGLAPRDGLEPEPETPASVQATLRQRALNLKQSAVEDEVELRQFFVFILGSEKYAIDIENVQKVLPVPELTPVPGSPEHFTGMINHAGDILWVLDLKKLIGLPSSLAGNEERIVVAEYGKAKLGFLADAVCDVADFPTTAIRPALASAEKMRDDYVTGEIYWQNELTAILDFTELCQRTEPAQPGGHHAR